MMPEGVPRLLGNVDVHRVRAGNPSTLTDIANVGRRQPFDLDPSRFDSRKGDLEIDKPGTLVVVLQLSP